MVIGTMDWLWSRNNHGSSNKRLMVGDKEIEEFERSACLLQAGLDRPHHRSPKPSVESTR